MKRTFWSPTEVAVLRERYPTTRAADLVRQLPGRSVRQILSKAWQLGLKREIGVIQQHARAAMLDPKHPARAHQFRPGHVTWNSGMKGWNAGGRSVETRFHKGHVNTGEKAERPLGTERVNSDGYLERKIRMDLRGAQRWAPVHRLNWIAINGPIPAGYSLAFKDGNKANVAIDNLELISNQEKMRRNTVHNLPPEVVEVVQLRGALVRKINKRMKGKLDEQRDHQ